MYDPTYTGKSRKTLEPIIVNSNAGQQDKITFFSPPNFSGKVQTSTGKHPPQLSDRHEIGYSRFDQKGSVLFANVDAVLNLTRHVGGYFASSTQNDNMHFYSLFFEDRNLELYSYLQWRLPYSITRLVSSSSVGRPDLENVNLDLVNYDITSIMEGRPIDGYQLMGTLSHRPLPLHSLTLMAMIMFSSLSRENGRGFFIMSYGSQKNMKGHLPLSALTDFIILLSSLFTQVWLFRPYMCYSFLCISVGPPKMYPEKDTEEEKQLLSLWTMLQRGNFGRIFDAVDKDSEIPAKVFKIVEENEEPEGRDRVEVLSRWQLPDQLKAKIYPRFKTSLTSVAIRKPIQQDHQRKQRKILKISTP